MTRSFHTQLSNYRDGTFTGKRLSDYVSEGNPNFSDARRIVNGVNKAALIAGYAQNFLGILNSSSYSGQQAYDVIDTVAEANQFFKTQFLNSKYNPDGPLSSGNCVPASLAMIRDMLGLETPGLSVQESINESSQLMKRARTDWTTLTELKRGISNSGGTPVTVRSKAEIDAALGNGYPIITNGMYDYAWRKQFPNYSKTGNGNTMHANVIMGKSQSGRYLIADPMYKQGVVEMSWQQLDEFFDNEGILGYAFQHNLDVPGSQNSGSVGQAAERQSYEIKSGDSLSAIAKRLLGSPARWKEITKSDGSSFSDYEARKLQVGQVVYLPGSQSANAGGQTVERQSYEIQSGDSLSAIAKRLLGSSARWTEITKADGSSFSDDEARQLQPGQTVYLPGSQMISGGIIGSNNNQSDVYTGSSQSANTSGVEKPSSTTSKNLRSHTQDYSSALQFNLNDVSLWGWGGNSIGRNLDSNFKTGGGANNLGGFLDFKVDLQSHIGIYASLGTANLKLPGQLDFSYNSSTGSFNIQSASIEGGQSQLSTYFGLGAGVSGKLGVKLEVNKNLFLVGKPSLSWETGFELKAEQLLDLALPKGVSTDLGLNTFDNTLENNTLEASDTAGIKFDFSNLLGSSKSKLLKDFATLDIGYNIEQESSLKWEGFRFDPDNIDNNGNEFEYRSQEDLKSHVFPKNLTSLRVQPIASLKTVFNGRLEASVGVSLQKVVDKAFGKPTFAGGVNFDLKSSINPKLMDVTVDTFNPFEAAKYWQSVSIA